MSMFRNNGKIAGELADLLSDGGADVYGWDLEWRMNYGIPTGARYNKIYIFPEPTTNEPLYLYQILNK